MVNVPVLSNNASSIDAADSRISPPLATKPDAEAAESAVACGTGAAKSKAHGQETTHNTRVVTKSLVTRP